jgi:hypothetical protein
MEDSRELLKKICINNQLYLVNWKVQVYLENLHKAEIMRLEWIRIFWKEAREKTRSGKDQIQMAERCREWFEREQA